MLPPSLMIFLNRHKHPKFHHYWHWHEWKTFPFLVLNKGKIGNLDKVPEMLHLSFLRCSQGECASQCLYAYEANVKISHNPCFKVPSHKIRGDLGKDAFCQMSHRSHFLSWLVVFPITKILESFNSWLCHCQFEEPFISCASLQARWDCCEIGRRLTERV